MTVRSLPSTSPPRTSGTTWPQCDGNDPVRCRTFKSPLARSHFSAGVYGFSMAIVSNYRDELQAAHQRIAALESTLAQKEKEQATRSQEDTHKPRRNKDASDVPLPAPSAEVRKFLAYAQGTAIPARLRWIHRFAALGFLVLHGILSALILWPHTDGPMVWAIVGFLLPVALAGFVGRFTRILVDPSVGHFDPGNPEYGTGPTVVQYTRRQALVALAVLLSLEGIWIGWALPTLQHASHHRPCPACQATGSHAP